ncbi:MAG: general secretion pathway protein GspK [Planctomycetes bacterium]|nr:general secretion pathway protein GspK [Planctomycetota bacterium]
MKTRHRPFSRRGVALLVTVVTIMAVTLIVSQIQLTTALEQKQIRDYIRVRQLQRVLDSAPGLAMRMLEEGGAGLAQDTLQDEWAADKYFDINIDDKRMIRLTVHIEDCARQYSLKPLLEEDPGMLEQNVQNFVEFARACGLDAGVADRLARAITEEADVRRSEDAVFLELTEEEQQAEEEAQEGAGNQPAESKTTQELVPLWLDDFKNVPGLEDEDRYAIERAYIERENPVDPTGPMVVVRFVDQVTMWRNKQPNINTAGREVLLYEVEQLKDHPEAVDEILIQRDEEPFMNVSQLGNIESLTQEEAKQLQAEVRLNSDRFRVTATATEYRIDEFGTVIEAGGARRKARSITILERRQGGSLYTLWRHNEQ